MDELLPCDSAQAGIGGKVNTGDVLQELSGALKLFRCNFSAFQDNSLS